MTALEVSTALTAAIAVWIAYRQHRNDHLRVTLELYERRFAVFRAFSELLTHISKEATAKEEVIFTFSEKTRDSYFLFGPRISDYLEMIFKQAWELRCQEKKIHGPSSLPVGPERTALCEANSELLKWFSRQPDVGRKKFKRYLALH